MNTNIKLNVTQIQRFCMHDGPGIRTTIFLKGCPLRCRWCHNPETQKTHREILFYACKCILCRACDYVCPQQSHKILKEHSYNRDLCTACGECVRICPTKALEICGEDMSIEQIMDIVEKDRAFYGKEGGVTISGGEPFTQGMNVVELLKKLKNKGFSTAIETCGYGASDVIKAAIPYTDIFLWDLKDTDDKRHIQYTGVSNKTIIDNLIMADTLGAKLYLRCILVNGVNTDDVHYQNIAKLALKLKNCKNIQLIPYHAYSGNKNVFIGEEDSGNKTWIPTEKQMIRAKEILSSILQINVTF